MAVFRVEKTKDFTIMCNHHLRNTELSLKAKGLLSLMLSLPEDWDYTTKGLAHICKDGVDSITTALKELERHGYLTRQRLRYGNGQLGDIEYTIHEKPVNAEKQEYSPKRENPRQVNPGQAKPEQAEPGQENPAQLNTNPLRTKKSKTDISRTHQSIYPAEPEAAGRPDRMDRIELTDAYREIIKENIEYDCMVSRYGKERLDETMELMLEVVLSKRPYIRIAGDDFPRRILPYPTKYWLRLLLSGHSTWKAVTRAWIAMSSYVMSASAMTRRDMPHPRGFGMCWLSAPRPISGNTSSASGYAGAIRTRPGSCS